MQWRDLPPTPKAYVQWLVGAKRCLPWVETLLDSSPPFRAEVKHLLKDRGYALVLYDNTYHAWAEPQVSMDRVPTSGVGKV